MLLCPPANHLDVCLSALPGRWGVVFYLHLDDAVILKLKKQWKWKLSEVSLVGVGSATYCVNGVCSIVKNWWRCNLKEKPRAAVYPRATAERFNCSDFIYNTFKQQSLQDVLTDFALPLTLSFFLGTPGLEMLSPRVQMIESVPRGSFSRCMDPCWGYVLAWISCPPRTGASWFWSSLHCPVVLVRG